MLSEDGASNVRWLRLDASTLKQQLVTLCDNWVSAFSGLLASLASRQLGGLHGELQAHVAALTGRPAPKAAAEGEDEADAEAAEGEQLQSPEGAKQAQEAEQAEAVTECAPAEVAEVAEAAAQVAEVDKQQAADELEALHGRLEGDREELAQRLAGCQEQYDALVSLQVRGGGGERACHCHCHCQVPAAFHSTTPAASLHDRCKPEPHVYCWAWLRCTPHVQVGVPEDELERVDALPALWAEFGAALEAVPARLRQLAA